jgi:hypothetical protein
MPHLAVAAVECLRNHTVEVAHQRKSPENSMRKGRDMGRMIAGVGVKYKTCPQA